MTDIRRHLPLILSCVRTHLTSIFDDVAPRAQALRAKLAELLPKSYGIGSGCLLNEQGELSQPFDIVIYDTTLTSAQTTDSGYDWRQVLVTITLAFDLDTVDLSRILEVVASMKRLHKAPAMDSLLATRHVARVLKKLQPLSIIGFRQLCDVTATESAKFSLLLEYLLKRYQHEFRPDYVIAHQYNLFYSNPLLTGQRFEETTINIARFPELAKPRRCYSCKQVIYYRHFFYERLCLACGDLNYRKRVTKIDLTGRIALVTGARINIGYETALRLLRSGAQVLVTTRFPQDAARRYSSEADFHDWQDRLHIYGLDFRYLPVLEHFIEHVHQTYPSLDILINNAAQTVRLPAAEYAALLAGERVPFNELSAAQQALVHRSHLAMPALPTLIGGEAEQSASAASSAVALQGSVISPASVALSQAPAELQPVQQNSWTMRLSDVSLTEFLEVQVVNVTAPFMLVSRLAPLLRRSSFPLRFIVNVSAVEGQFSQNKLGVHPHTNMAKASLNMLTHTSAAELAQEGIAMNSVDPGWVSQQVVSGDEIYLPLDMLDAASRVCDPIFEGIKTEQAVSGQFYKDYRPVAW